MNYALITDGVVANLIYLHPMNADDFSSAVPTEDLPVQIGDTYADGKFYRNGEEVVPVNVLTDAQISAIKDQAVAEIEEAVINGTDE